MRLTARLKPTGFPTGFTDYLRMGVSTYRGKLIVQLSFWSAAIATGAAAVYFGRLIETIQDAFRHEYILHPYILTICTPVTFVAAAAVVKYLAPHAGGSGVPQVLHATNVSAQSHSETMASGLVSVRTALVKVLSTCIGFAGGASIGGEGPTVQIAGSIFAAFGDRIKRRFPHIDFHSYLVAAAGAGIASAFNTPLGGVVFALEEVAVGDFGGFRHLVLLAVIVSGLAAQAIIGDDLYFGNPNVGGTSLAFALWAVPIGIIGGLFGGLFGRLVASKTLHELKVSWWVRAGLLGLLVTLINWVFRGDTAGSGYALTHAFMNSSVGSEPVLFAPAKLVATAASTLSGMGGGILAPSLTIGGWLGIACAKVAALPNLKVCALLGMVAYFTGAFQIPLTAAVVVMEMTNEHDIIFPMLIAALCAFGAARLLMPVPLYHLLIARSFEKKELSD